MVEEDNGMEMEILCKWMIISTITGWNTQKKWSGIPDSGPFVLYNFCLICVFHKFGFQPVEPNKNFGLIYDNNNNK